MQDTQTVAQPIPPTLDEIVKENAARAVANLRTRNTRLPRLRSKVMSGDFFLISGMEIPVEFMDRVKAMNREGRRDWYRKNKRMWGG